MKKYNDIALARDLRDIAGRLSVRGWDEPQDAAKAFEKTARALVALADYLDDKND